MTFRVGDRLRLAGSRPRHYWTVRATGGAFIVATRQAPFYPRGVLEYTVLVPGAGIRGAANTIGNGWSLDPEDNGEAGVRSLLEALTTGRFEVSHRNRVPLSITAHLPKETPRA